MARAQPPPGLGGAKGRELGQHRCRRGRRAASGGGGVPRKASWQTSPLPSPLDPSKNTLGNRAEEAAPSPRAPGLALPTPAPGSRQRARWGQRRQRLLFRGPARQDAGNPTSPARAERADTPGTGAGARAAGKVPRSGNFPSPGASGAARCASPEPGETEPLGRRLPDPRGRAGCASPVRRRVGALRRGEERAGAGRLGGQGRGGQRGERRDDPRRAAAARSLSAPVEGAGPAPTRARCRETRVGRRALCIKAAVTSRGARAQGSERAGPRLGGGAGGGSRV